MSPHYHVIMLLHMWRLSNVRTMRRFRLNELMWRSLLRARTAMWRHWTRLVAWRHRLVIVGRRWSTHGSGRRCVNMLTGHWSAVIVQRHHTVVVVYHGYGLNGRRRLAIVHARYHLKFGLKSRVDSLLLGASCSRFGSTRTCARASILVCFPPWHWIVSGTQRRIWRTQRCVLCLAHMQCSTLCKLNYKFVMSVHFNRAFCEHARQQVICTAYWFRS